jgi:hypothetical protein
VPTAVGQSPRWGTAANATGELGLDAAMNVAGQLLAYVITLISD